MATCSTSKSDEEENLKFHELGLHDWLTDQCKAMGLKKPTAIQQNCIPPILRGIHLVILIFVSHVFAMS